MSVPEQNATPEASAPPRGIRSVIDLAFQNPYIHFMVSEFWAGIASGAVYVFYHSVAYFIQFFALILPLQQRAPAEFLEATLHWGAALGASGTFGIVTVYQIVVLVKRLIEDLRR